MLECPHCHKPIYDKDALFCLYCGESLGRSAGFMGYLKSPRGRLVATLVGLLVIISFFILYIL